MKIDETEARQDITILPFPGKVVQKPKMLRSLKRTSNFTLVDKDGEILNFYPGLLLMYGATNTGKSTTGYGLVFEAAKQGIISSHQIWDEVGTRIDTPLTPISKITKGGITIPFAETAVGKVKEGTSFINEYIKIISDIFIKENPSLYVIDSIGPALALASSLVDQPAGRGAMVEGYGMFLRMINAMAVNQDCTIIGLINKSLFSVESLEGAADGVLEMTSKGSFTKRDRTDRTTNSRFTLSEDSIRLALEWQDSTTKMSNDIATLGGMK